MGGFIDLAIYSKIYVILQYSSNLSEKKIVKLTEEAAQINRLKEMKK